MAFGQGRTPAPQSISIAPSGNTAEHRTDAIDLPEIKWRGPHPTFTAARSQRYSAVGQRQRKAKEESPLRHRLTGVKERLTSTLRRSMDSKMHFYFLVALLTLGAFLPTEGCKCLSRNLQRSFCSGNVALKVKFLSVNYTDESNEYYTYTLTIYEVEVLQVFKGDNDIQNLKHIYASTEYDCEFFISPFDYNIEGLVTGLYQGGRLLLMYCDYVFQWSALSASQIKGIEGAYTKGCDCNILSCKSWQCNTATIDGCILKEDYQYYDQDYPDEVTSPAPEEDNTPQEDKMCARNENGICTWQSVE